MEPFIIDQQLTLFPRHLERQHQQQQKTSAAKKLKFLTAYLRAHPLDPYFIFCMPQNSGRHLSQRVPPTPGKQEQMPVAASQLLNPNVKQRTK